MGGEATPNRRLLDRKIFLDFEKPFDLIPRYKKTYSKEILAETKSKNRLSSSKNSQCLIWSKLLYHARTYFEQTTSINLWIHYQNNLAITTTTTSNSLHRLLSAPERRLQQAWWLAKHRSPSLGLGVAWQAAWAGRFRGNLRWLFRLALPSANNSLTSTSFCL